MRSLKKVRSLTKKSPKKILPMLGKKFGSWTVLSISQKKSNDGIYFWRCQCECGAVKDVRGQNLRNGASKSCNFKCSFSKIQRQKSQFLRNCVKTINGCWIWIGTLRKNGHGLLNKKEFAHEYSYQSFVGKIPKGKKVHHQCTHILCVNPRHLSLKD